MRQLQRTEDSHSSKEQIEAKIESYHGIVIRSRFKIDKTLLDKASNLQFIARVGAGLESIDCDYAASKKNHAHCPEGNRNSQEHTRKFVAFNNLNKADREI
jgi:D-3-phosphoglycerate dehydrogenase